MPNVGTLVLDLIANVGKFHAQMTSAQQAVKQTGRTFTRAGRTLSMTVTAPLVGAGALAVKTAADFQTLRQSMDILNQSAAEGARNFERLVEFSARTPFQLQDLARAQNMLQGFGLAADEAFDSLSMIGDIAAVSGGSIQGIGIAFGQAAAEGRLMTRDIRQLINQGVPAIKLLADTMNVTESEVLSLAEEGRISFEILQQAFRDATQAGGMFADGMEKQSKTIAGLFSTLKDNISIALADIGEILIEEFNLDQVIQEITHALRNMSDETKVLIVRIGSIAAVVGPLTLALGALATVLGAISLPMLAIVGAGAAIATTFIWIRQNTEALTNKFINLRKKILPVLKALEFVTLDSVRSARLSGLIAGLESLGDEFEATGGEAQSFKGILESLSDFARDLFRGLVPEIDLPDNIESFTDNIKRMGLITENIPQRFQDIANAIMSAITQAASFQDVLANIRYDTQAIASVAVPSLKESWSVAVSDMAMVAVSLGQQLSTAFSTALTDIVVGAMTAAEAFKNAWRSAIRSILSQITANAALFGLARIFTADVGSAALLATGGRSKTFLGSLFGSLFGFANGGRPPVGMPSIVGERGPEVFVPDTRGTIIPNHALGRAMGGGQIEITGVLTGRGDTLEARVTRARQRKNRVL